MRRLGKQWIIPIALIALFVPLMISPDPSVALSQLPVTLNVGPYVDKIVYKVIYDQNQKLLALQAGEIDMDLGFFDPAHLSVLDADPDIDIYGALRNGYGHITINCEKYPLNISGFRRAFAYAFDKVGVTEDVMDGFSLEHDSLVPFVNGWCIEDALDWHYYTDQSAIGNQILNSLNFSIDSGTGYRLAPDGSAFNIWVDYPSDGSEVQVGVAQEAADALQSLYVDADIRSVDSELMFDRLNNHDDYDMVHYGTSFSNFDVDWLAYEYWSDYASLPYLNPCNFRNLTYDSWRDQLLHATTYEEVFEAAEEMQKILHYNVPRLVVYTNQYLQAYRNDRFTDFIPDLGRHITGPWTMRHIRQLDGTPGGTVSIGIDTEPDSFNIWMSNTSSSKSMFDELWPSLVTYAPDMTPYPYLIEQMLTETHDDNPSVPEGHTRFTIDIIEDAVWSDYTPVTAVDVAFTQTYIFESGLYGNPAADDMENLVAAYAPTSTRAIIEFGTESYWHFSHFAYDYIIPEHIFSDVIGYADWLFWNPVYDPAEPHVNSGPFGLTDLEPGEFYELTVNIDFVYYPQSPPPPDHIVTTPDTTTSTSPNGGPINPINLATTFVTGASSVIIIVMILEIIRNKKDD